MDGLFLLFCVKLTFISIPLEEVSFERLINMRLEDFRIEVAVLTRQELASIADVSISSIQRAEEGKGVSRLTQARILKGLSQHLGRIVSKEEIDEFKDF
jgi:DNA-binding XRE family transcriptional regulator